MHDFMCQIKQFVFVQYGKEIVELTNQKYQIIQIETFHVNPIVDSTRFRGFVVFGKRIPRWPDPKYSDKCIRPFLEK